MGTRSWLTILGIIAAGVVAALGLIVLAMPLLIKPAMRLMFCFHYKFRLMGVENLPQQGPVLVVCNHVTWIDAFILAATSPRPIWYLTNADYINMPIVRNLARRGRMIPVPSKGPRSQRQAIEEARKALDQGKAVAIFPEAQLTRNGRIGTFLRGLELILGDRQNVAVVPVFFENLWGSIFSFSHGHFLGRFSEVARRRVTIVFGPALVPPITAFSARQAVAEAAVRAFALRDGTERKVVIPESDLPCWQHPELGLLAASTLNFDHGGIRQVGEKPGTMGQSAPGVAIRAVAADGRVLPAAEIGRLEALIAGRDEWIDTGMHGCLDKEGFIKVIEHL